MPSWNIHVAHVERLLAEREPAALGIRDANAFLFGNLVPDIYVGYMVPDPSRKIPYKDTHFAEPGHIPEPRYWEFFERFAAPSADAAGRVSDVVLGAWAHLVADNTYNRRFNRHIFAHGVEPGERTRIRKQADLDLFGRTLAIRMVPEATPALLAQAAAFPQYAIEEPDVRGTCTSVLRIVRDNAARPAPAQPAYDLLDAAFFSEVPEEADALILAGLTAYAAGDPAWGAVACGAS